MLIGRFDVFRFCGNQVIVILFGMIWVNVILYGVIWVNLIWDDVIQFFAPILFNFKNMIAPRIFENAVASRVFTYCCIMPQWCDPVGKIRCTLEGEVESTLPGNLWVIASDGSLWVYPNVVITSPPRSSSLHFSMTLQNYEGDFPITVYPSVNGSDILVRVDGGWVTHRFVETCSRKYLR